MNTNVLFLIKSQGKKVSVCLTLLILQMNIVIHEEKKIQTKKKSLKFS